MARYSADDPSIWIGPVLSHGAIGGVRLGQECHRSEAVLRASCQEHLMLLYLMVGHLIKVPPA